MSAEREDQNTADFNSAVILGQPILHELIVYHKGNPHLLEIIQLLLDAGADVNVIDSGKTPLDRAMGFKDECPDDPQGSKMVDLFKRYGAKTSTELRNSGA